MINYVFVLIVLIMSPYRLESGLCPNFRDWRSSDFVVIVDTIEVRIGFQLLFLEFKSCQSQ